MITSTKENLRCRKISYCVWKGSNPLLEILLQILHAQFNTKKAFVLFSNNPYQRIFV